MRLWHKDLIKYLPKNQLVGQWRECCAIAKNIAEKGFPNHRLVNKIMYYPLEHFLRYCELVQLEMAHRGYKASMESVVPYLEKTDCNFFNIVMFDEVFFNWHTNRYLMQCLYNLEEKYDCGIITMEEWTNLVSNGIIAYNSYLLKNS